MEDQEIVNLYYHATHLNGCLSCLLRAVLLAVGHPVDINPELIERIRVEHEYLRTQHPPLMQRPTSFIGLIDHGLRVFAGGKNEVLRFVADPGEYGCVSTERIAAAHRNMNVRPPWKRADEDDDQER